MSETPLYEILGYDSKKAFEARSYSVLDSDLKIKSLALLVGKLYLKNYPIVKVQSHDREFIKILKKPLS